MPLHLAVPPTVPEAIVRDRNLFIEAGTNPEDAALATLTDRVTSAHAPFFLPQPPVAGTRLHLASTDPDFRELSVQLIERYVEQAHARFRNLRLIVSHAAPHYFPDPPVRPGSDQPRPALRPDLASWDLLLESLGRLARRCRALGLLLSVENNWAYWNGVPPDADITKLGPGDFVEYFCTSPEEWLALPQTLNEPNVSSCLDPSHAGPYCHRFIHPHQRRAALARYLANPQQIGHLHWNDSDIEDSRGREDLHLCVGEGTLGPQFHAALKARALQLDHPVTLEHFHGEEALDRELQTINSL